MTILILLNHHTLKEGHGLNISDIPTLYAQELQELLPIMLQLENIIFNSSLMKNLAIYADFIQLQ